MNLGTGDGVGMSNKRSPVAPSVCGFNCHQPCFPCEKAEALVYDRVGPETRGLRLRYLTTPLCLSARAELQLIQALVLWNCMNFRCFNMNIMWQTIWSLTFLKLRKSGDWRSGYMVRRVHCSRRGPAPLGWLTLPVTLSPGDQMPFVCILCVHLCVCAYTQTCVHLHK